MMARCLWVAAFAISICVAQDGELATFGTTVVVPGGLTGKVYAISEYSTKLPKFEKLEPIGTIYAKGVFIPPRDFDEGFPGITNRIEWFAIDFTGRFYVEEPGKYRFQLASDDGSKLYIDGKTVIDNDGVHATEGVERTVTLSGGIHTIRLSYFQGPRFHLSLMLSVAGPRDKQFRPFHTDRFKPPANPADWKYGSPEPVPPSTPNPDAGRRNLKDVLRRENPVVPLSVEVLSQGKAVRGLTAGDFVIHDNGQTQEIAEFGFADQPLDILLMFDGSAGMEPFYERVKGAVSGAMASLGANDRVGVVQFREQAVLAVDLTAIREMTLAAVRKLQTGPAGKDLNASIALTAMELKKRARTDAARAVVIVTDNDGPVTVANRVTRDGLWLSGVTLSAIFVNDRVGAADVRPFVAASGGDWFVMDEKIVPLAEIFRALRERYRIAYKAPGGTANTIRSISVELSAEAKAKFPDATIRVRGGYVVE